jgi:hypothetical protein
MTGRSRIDTPFAGLGGDTQVMKAQLFPVFLVGLAFATSGCERKPTVVEPSPSTPVLDVEPKTKTLETMKLGRAVDVYEREPTTEHAADVKKALADLDGEIAELEALVAKRSGAEREEAAVKLRNLQTYRATQVMRFNVAQAKPGIPAPEERNGRTGAEKVEDAARRAGQSIEDAAKKTGDAVEDAARKTGDAIKDAVR